MEITVIFKLLQYVFVTEEKKKKEKKKHIYKLYWAENLLL